MLVISSHYLPAKLAARRRDRRDPCAGDAQSLSAIAEPASDSFVAADGLLRGS